MFIAVIASNSCFLQVNILKSIYFISSLWLIWTGFYWRVGVQSTENNQSDQGL